MGAAVLVVLLGFEYRALDTEFRQFRETHDHPQVGEFVPPVHGTTLDGAKVTLGPGTNSERQVIFILNTTCPFCLASLPAWKEITDRLKSENTVHVYGVSLDPPAATREYAAEHQLTFPIISVEPQRFVSYYRTKAIPLTLVIDSAGHVIRARSQSLAPGGAAVDSVVAAARPPAHGF